MKRLYSILKTLLGCLIGVFAGSSLYRCWDYAQRPELYAMDSAPWYGQILLSGTVTVVVAEAPHPPAPVQKIAAAPNQKPEPAPAAAVETTHAGQEVNDADRPAKRETAVSREEMKRLIQAAGQSLRGRTNP